MSIGYRQYEEMEWQTVLDGFSQRSHTNVTPFIYVFCQNVNALRLVNAFHCARRFYRDVFILFGRVVSCRESGDVDDANSLHLLACPVLSFSVFSTQPLSVCLHGASGSAYFPRTKFSHNISVSVLWWWCQSARTCMRHFSLVLRWLTRNSILHHQFIRRQQFQVNRVRSNHSAFDFYFIFAEKHKVSVSVHRTINCSPCDWLLFR